MPQCATWGRGLLCFRTTACLFCCDIGSTCDRYAGSEGYFNVSDSRTCFVLFPQRNSRATVIWYEARNKCLLEGGDLAGEAVIRLRLNTTESYIIGLRRITVMWTESSKISLG